MARRSRTATRPLAGRVVAITGAARGLGLATAQALAGRGALVALGDLDGELAEREAAALPSRAVGGSVDVADRESFGAFLDRVEAALGPLDVLINNAGLMVVSPFTAESDSATQRQLQVNVFGVILGCKLAIERMRPRRDGHLVNVASIAGKVGVAGEAVYSATKHAVVGLSESLRSELRDDGIRVSCVMPGLANTELASGMQAGRGVKLVEPGEVAAEIVDALERPRFDVYVPPRLGAIVRTAAALPRPAAEALERAFESDKVAGRTDQAARRAYHERVLASEDASPAEEAMVEAGSAGR